MPMHVHELVMTCLPVQDSLIANLLRLIKKMKPKSKQKSKGQPGKSERTWDEREVEEESKKSDRDINKQLFPALAMPNDPHIRVCLQFFSSVGMYCFFLCVSQAEMCDLMTCYQVEM